MVAGRNGLARAHEQPSADHRDGQPANTRIHALTGRRGGPVDTFGGEITGTAAGVCLAV